MRIPVNNDGFHVLVRAFLRGLGGQCSFFSFLTRYQSKYASYPAFIMMCLPSMDDHSGHEARPEQKVENKSHGPPLLPPGSAIRACSWEKQKWDPDVEGVAEGHHRALGRKVRVWINSGWGSKREIYTRINALSSESSLTIVFTVEYKMGLRQPETPKRYHATNLYDG